MNIISKRVFTLSIIYTMTIAILMVVSRSFGFFEYLNLKSLSLFQKLQNEEVYDENIVIVTIAEPIYKSDLIDSINILMKDNPVAVGLSITNDKNIYLEEDDGSTSLIEKNTEKLLLSKKILGKKFDIAINMEKYQKNIFSDILLDRDFVVRRYLLGTNDSSHNPTFYKSLAMSLSELYLKTKDYTLVNGLDDKYAMSFIKTGKSSRKENIIEIPRIRKNYKGGYRYDGNVVGGVQTIIRYRCFNKNDNLMKRIITLAKCDNDRKKLTFPSININDIISKTYDSNIIEGKIIIIGTTGRQLGNTFYQTPLANNYRHFSDDVEVHAHMTSQIISSVINKRHNVNMLHDNIEYIVIFLACMLGFYISFNKFSIFAKILYTGISATIVFIISMYIFNFLGYWIPVFVPLSALLLSSMLLTVFSFSYTKILQDQQEEIKLKELETASKIQQIQYTYNLIHNSVLQNLNSIIRSVKDKRISYELLPHHLEIIKNDIRNTFQYLLFEAKNDEQVLKLSSGQLIRVDNEPAHSILYSVCSYTLQLELAYFTESIVLIRSFDPFQEGDLSSYTKKMLALFLEELLINIGKYAKGVNVVTATGVLDDKQYTLCVEDNGIGISDDSSNRQEKFSDFFNEIDAIFLCHRKEDKWMNSKGTVCSLSWSIK